MKVSAIIRKSLKVVAWTLMSLMLLLMGVLILLYSPWSQDNLRRYLVNTLNEQGMDARIDSFSLRFPLDVELGGVEMSLPGDERIKAGKLTASVRILPLLKGEAKISRAELDSGFFSIGNPDTTMFMTIHGDKILLSDASVGLANMDIDLSHGVIDGGRVALTLNPDTTAADTTATSAPTKMKVNVRDLDLRDFQYSMRMLPTIDSLGAAIPEAKAKGIAIDLLKQTIGVGSFTGDGLDAAYIAPDSATIAATPVVPPSTSTSAPWTIRIDTIGFTDSKALYTTQGVKPLPGLDFTYIQADSLTLGIHDFYNQATTVKVPISLTATERCGVTLTATGALDIDSVGTNLVGFHVTTPNATDLSFNALLGMGDMTTDPATPLKLNLAGELAMDDARLMFPAFMPYFVALPEGSMLKALADINGTSGNLDIKDLSLLLNGVVSLRANGNVQNAFDFANIGGNIDLEGSLIDLNSIKNAILDKKTASQFNVPLTTLDGHVSMHRGHIKGDLAAKTHDGKISLDADWNSRLEDYDVVLSTDRFPVNAFMPLMGVGQVSADVMARGHGYNPFKPTMKLDADMRVKQAVYQGYDYSGIEATAKIADGHADIDLSSNNPNARFDLTANGNLTGDEYKWVANLDGQRIDLQALKLSETEAVLTANLDANATMSPNFKNIDAALTINSLDYTDEITTTNVRDVYAHLTATDSTTNLSLRNRDLHASVFSQAPLDTIMNSFTRVSEIMDAEIKAMVINVDTLQKALPPFVFDLDAGSDNMLTDLLKESRTKFKNLHIKALNDQSLSLGGRLLELTTPTMALDTIGLDISQYGDKLVLDGKVENRPGTFDEWAHVKLVGLMSKNKLGLHVSQENIEDKEGYNLGLQASVADSTVTINFTPTDPTIAYMPWTINEDNFIEWSFAHKHLDANLHMHSATSSLAIYTNHIEGQDDHQEELVIDINDIQLADWIKLNPFAPPITGALSADMKLSVEDNTQLNGKGFIDLKDFNYGKKRVGDVHANLDLSTAKGDFVRANAELLIDGQKSVTLTGALNDTTAASPLAMDLSLIHFPLKALNPFLPADVAQLRGNLNGSMDVTGEGTDPKLNGWLQLDSTAVRLAMTGTDYEFNDVKIPVENNLVQFNNFAVRGTNENPMTLNGTVDIRSFSDPKIDLILAASDMQIVNTTKAPRGADIFGRAWIDLVATAKGNMEFMQVDAELTLRSGTNVTYVMPEMANALAAQQNADMVKFVNFADTSAVLAADTVAKSQLALLVNAELTIQNGSTVNLYLSNNGRDRVSLQPNGSVDLSMQPFGEPRLTGRINLPKGFARYNVPVIGEKSFDLDESSYVAFNGDMMNPTLNIHAVDVVKANVTQQGQNSRLVNFDVTLGITGTLNRMNAAFDLSTTDDITVANELQSMSAEQRANQAMNMLLYNVYSGPGTRADSNLSGNAVYSFLTSQLNSWAANTIKGVDLTFGVDQYNRTLNGSTSQTTSYSYQVSKSLFNDRFKIVVGGNYSTDANSEENFSQNLIKDISFEYFLNRAQTMYIRLFRHTGYESILEGEITKTGVGFVFKRRAPRFKQLFIPNRKKKEDNESK